MLCYFVAIESTSVMRQEEGRINSQRSSTPIAFGRWNFLLFSSSGIVKNIFQGANTRAVLVCCKSIHLTRSLSLLCYIFFLLQMSMQGRILLVIILVSVWRVVGK